MDRTGVTACHSRAVITSAGRIISSFASRANSHTSSMCRVCSHDASIDCHILALWSWAILPLHGWNPSIRTSPSCTLNFWRLTHGINGIPHSLPNCHENYWDSPISSLTGFGIPQFSPGVYGIPHALFRLSPKVFCFWNCHIHCNIAWLSTGLFITATRPRSLGRHGLYLEFDHELTSCNRFRMTIQ